MSQGRILGTSSAVPLGKTDSQSSDYFDDDPEFAEALATMDDSALFGSQPLACLDNVSNSLPDSGARASQSSSQNRKRKRSISPLSGQENSQEEPTRINSSNDQPNSSKESITIDDITELHFPTLDTSGSIAPLDTYAASKFGGLGDYMRRKRAKLQNQNENIGTQSSQLTQTSIFKSVAIYITGRTNPSLQILRAMIVQHGGQFHAYLDRKEMITHVITNNLTPVKALEFKHMKVVRPDWLVDSVAANKLLPWSDYRWVPQADTSTQNIPPPTPISTPRFRPPFSTPANSSASRSTTQEVTNDAFSLTPITQSADANDPTSKLTPARVPPAPNPTSIQPSTPSCSAPITVGSPQSTENAYVNKKPTEPSPSGILPFSDSTIPPRPAPPPPIPRRPMPPPPPPAASAGPSRPSYAAHTSNPEAERLMESAEWREAHTSASGEAFIQGYYQHSRLHHLSKWKAELRDLVSKAQEDAEAQLSNEGIAGPGMLSVESLNARRKDKGKGKATEKVIMHCDFDSFFVAAGLTTRPELKGKPVVVCHASGKGASHSTSEIASASYAARAFGIKNGMSLGQARKLCSEIQTIPYEFERYKELSLKFYTILMALSDDLQAVSVDEALIDVTSAVGGLRRQVLESGNLQAESYEKQVAENIRDRVRAATGCEVSVGIGPNIMLARLATKRAKPAGSYFLSITDAPAHIAGLDVVDLHGFAGAVRDKAITTFGTSKLQDLAKESKSALQQALGDKSGDRVWNAIRGVDDRVLESDKPRKSVSADVNYGIRFESNEHAEKFMYGLGREVSDRLKAINKRGRTLTLKIMKRHPNAPREAPKFMGHGKCETFNKTGSISGARGAATDDPNIIGREAWKLLQAMDFDPTELRGIGIQIQKLAEADGSTIPRAAAAQGQLAMRFKQVAAKANTGRQSVSVDAPRPASPILAPEVSIIDVDALDDEEILKPAIGSKQTPFDLTMLSQLGQSGVAEILNNGNDRARSLSIPRQGPTAAGSSKAASLSPRRAQQHKRLTNMGPPMAIPNQPKFFPVFSRQLAPIPDQELVSLGIDPMAFANMSKEEQKTLVLARRTAKGLDGVGRPIHQRRRRFQEAQNMRVYKVIQAGKTELPTLRAAKPGAPVVTETSDVQDMIRAWVETKVQKKLGPDTREVVHFGGFLEKSMVTNQGMQRTAEVMKWWRHVCMNSWGQEQERRGEYGREWWVAWWDVKDKLDAIVKKRFGGKLNLD
ncbi:DNA repair protein [Ceratobasidium sp. AG-I]|nr:DNA repair protein [Ceratobasidium sp. AG-I]